jgi:GTPase SAR1 family protein
VFLAACSSRVYYTGYLMLCRDLKLIVLGSANVGKTTLLQRYLTGDFADTISVSSALE